MQSVSEAYKKCMKQLARNQSQMRISIGLINQKAQMHAGIKDSSFTYFSNQKHPFENETVEKVYATFEDNYAAVNGSMYFLPREDSEKKLYNAGMVSEGMCGEETADIKVSFNLEDPVDVKGLTLTFGKSYPLSFRIETDSGTTVYENSTQQFITEDVFSNITFMKFIPLIMNNGDARFRINTIMFGIGIIFDDKKIISADLKNIISAIGLDIQTIDFDATIENYDRYYNVDNASSAINFMETGQKMEVYYALALDSGELEWIKGNTLYMKEWSADDTQAKFGSVDRFEYMQDYYMKGKYIQNGVSLYSLAEDVLNDAGVAVEDYWIDPYLQTVIVYNPLPVVMHKECLQLIASAGRCILMQNRDGVITLQSSFIPDITVSANQTADYADVQEILTGTEYSEYAAFESNYIRTNQTQYFIPRNQSYLKTGYVSESISDEYGYFIENPVITFNLESAYTFYNITLQFGSVQPVEISVRAYNNNVKKKTYSCTSIAETTILTYEFMNVDKIEVEFVKAEPFNRIHLKRVKFGDATDYKLTYNELLKTPSGTKLEKVKEIQVTRTLYTKGTEQTDILQEELTLSTEVVSYEFQFSNAVHDLSVVCMINDVVFECGAEIVESGSYWCKVRINEPPNVETAVSMKIKGYEFGISTATKSRKINNSGKVQTWENPLISTEETANNIAEWVGNYYSGENEYDLSFRGDPAIDANDLLFLESLYSEKLVIRVEEIETSYSGGIKGKITARREV